MVAARTALPPHHAAASVERRLKAGFVADFIGFLLVAAGPRGYNTRRI
jgi:hypothetical protein